jgi:hypothetical protein
MVKDITVHVQGIHQPIGPYAFQHYARDFYAAYRSHRTEFRFSPARLFLIGRAIELAAKALHLAQGKTASTLRKLGHDLERACAPAVLSKYGITITPEERRAIVKANEYYSRKGFEYFLFSARHGAEDRSGPQLALEGWPNLPGEDALQTLVEKLLTPSL